MTETLTKEIPLLDHEVYQDGDTVGIQILHVNIPSESVEDLGDEIIVVLDGHGIHSSKEKKGLISTRIGESHGIVIEIAKNFTPEENFTGKVIIRTRGHGYRNNQKVINEIKNIKGYVWGMLEDWNSNH